jgi:hypothetical protein
VTRFSLSSADLHNGQRLEDDIPTRYLDWLTEAIVFYKSFRMEAGPPESLRALPWRALVYEGRNSERPVDILNLLKPTLGDISNIIGSTQVTDGEGHSRPITIFLRK